MMSYELLGYTFPWLTTNAYDYRSNGLKAPLRSKNNNGYEVKEEEDKTIVEVDVPGYKGDELSISFDNKILTIIGENDKRGRIELSFRINTEGLTTENSKASIHDGVLKIELIKDKPTKKEIKII